MNYGLSYGTWLIKYSLGDKYSTIVSEIIWRCQIGKRLKRVKVSSENYHKLLYLWLLERRGVVFHVLKPTRNVSSLSLDSPIKDYALIVGTFLIIHCLNHIISWAERLTRNQRNSLDALVTNILPELVCLCQKTNELVVNEKNYRQFLRQLFISTSSLKNNI